MFGALCYLQFWGAVNRVRAQLRRLRQPKYFAGALLAGAYVFFFFLRPILLSPPGGRGAAGAGAPRVAAENLELLTLGGAALVFFLVALNWVVAKDRAALGFTEAEAAFLLPAPLTRRMLIHYKLVKTQFGLLFSAVFLALCSRMAAGSGDYWRHVLGWWLLVATLDLHALGASFARTFLLDRGLTHWRRRLAVLVLLVVFAGLTYRWLLAALPASDAAAWEDWPRLAAHLQLAAQTAPLSWVLWPFVTLVRPLMSSGGSGFWLALPPALGLLALHYLWVVRSQVAFEEATLERARRVAQTAAAMRAGDWHLAAGRNRRQRAPFALAPTGLRAMALVWKNLIAAGAAFTPRFLLTLTLLWFGGGLAAVTLAPGSAWSRMVGAFSLMAPSMLFLMGPHFARFDFRQDLPRADLLKTYPLPGWQVVLGEVLAPAVLLTVLQWVAVASAVMFLPGLNPARHAFAISHRLSLGLAAGLLALPLNVASLLWLNGAALWFPAWVRTGTATGFEGMGQGMLLMLAHMLALGLTLVLPAGAFAVVLLVGRAWLGWVAVPVAAGVAAVVLALEAAAGVRMLGDLWERADLTELS